jgi:gluconokinase
MIHNTTPDATLPPSSPIVVMGVSGCGKSSLGDALARALGIPFVEGDEYHSAECREQMRAGIALTDADRTAWLQRLVTVMRSNEGRGVLSCSALKKRYRDRLRSSLAGLRFLYLDVTPQVAADRVQSRGAAHYFPATLVQSQFEALEPPAGETDVLWLDAREPVPQLLDRASAWLAAARPL